MDLISASAGSAAMELATSHALMRQVAAGELGATIRVYRPRPAAAFSKRDTLRPGFLAAARAAEARGFEPVVRSPGGSAAAYHEQSLGVDIVRPDRDVVARVNERFEQAAQTLAVALATLGVDARVGEVPGEYCPGAYSVNARGEIKLVGIAQRLIRGAALLGAVIVVRDGAGIREVLRDVYAALELEWVETTAGAVADELPDVSVEAVEAAVIGAFATRSPAIHRPLGTSTAALAERLVDEHRPTTWLARRG